jgi:hypothetical protein
MSLFSFCTSSSSSVGFETPHPISLLVLHPEFFSPCVSGDVAACAADFAFDPCVPAVAILCVLRSTISEYWNLIGRRFRRPLSMPSAIFGIYVGG